MTFEKRLERLEQISDQIREGDIELERALRLFEEGMKLAHGLEKELARIERKVQILVNDPVPGQEEPTLELFPELADDEGQTPS